MDVHPRCVSSLNALTEAANLSSIVGPIDDVQIEPLHGVGYSNASLSLVHREPTVNCFSQQSTLHCTLALSCIVDSKPVPRGCYMNLRTVLKLPSAFLPVAMSFAALATVLGHVAMFGVVREADEGTAAHIFQLLLIAQLPVVAFFAIKWLPQTPRQALQVLALQAGAGLAALAPVFLLGL